LHTRLRLFRGQLDIARGLHVVDKGLTLKSSTSVRRSAAHNCCATYVLIALPKGLTWLFTVCKATGTPEPRSKFTSDSSGWSICKRMYAFSA
jgi:hypothetical protein